MKITFASFFAVIVTLIAAYVLQPLNAGAIGVVLFLSWGIGLFIAYIFQRITKKKEK